MQKSKYLFLFLITLFFASCEYLESPDDTASPSEGFITYPSIAIEGEQFVTINLGDTFEDPGAIATLGTEDITSMVVKTGMVDSNLPGVYVLDYSVSVTNALDETSTASQQRYVAVITESVKDLDLTGQYSGDGTAVSGAWNQAATVTSISGAWYNIDKALASGNNLGIFFAVVGGGGEGTPNRIVVPNQLSRFGFVNSTQEGTNAVLNENGFQWEIYISCCGIFGPIIYSR